MDRQETLRWIQRIPPCATELTGQDIVVLSHQRWDTHFTTVHGTVLRLAQQNRVLYMEPPDSIAWIRHQSAARHALSGTFNRFEVFNAHFALYHTPPLFLPMQAHSRVIVWWLNTLYRRMTRDGMRRMDMTDPILWVFQFNVVGVVDHLNPKLTLYECLEDAAAFARGETLRRYVRGMDAELCRKADVVFVANAQMYDARRALCHDIHMHPWPADVEHYNRAMDPQLPVPDDIAHIEHPIIGFYGMMDPCRFDAELLGTIARRNPEWNIVLIGGQLQGYDPRPLGTLPNVHPLGMRPVEYLPAYVKAFDVCTIPYSVNDFTRSITPLKLAEYLATGKPVVSTAIPAAEMLAHVVRVAHNADEFETQIRDALRDPSENIEGRLEVARRNNWDQYMRRKTAIANARIHTAQHEPT